MEEEGDSFLVIWLSGKCWRRIFTTFFRFPNELSFLSSRDTKALDASSSSKSPFAGAKKAKKLREASASKDPMKPIEAS